MQRGRVSFGLLLFALAGCSEDGQIGTNRADSGIALEDGGLSGPLALQAGWVFEYMATLTVREGAREKQSAYRLTLTIDSIDDRGLDGDSTATARATGSNLVDTN